jgi:hypothetical protein
MTTCPTHVLLQRLFRAADAFAAGATLSVRFDPLIFGITEFVRFRVAATAATISGAAKPHLHRFDHIVH